MIAERAMSEGAKSGKANDQTPRDTLFHFGYRQRLVRK